MSAFLLLAALALAPITISGTVSTEDGKPIAGAQVMIHHSGRTDTAASDAKGEF